MRYILRDRSKSSYPILGIAELNPGVMPSDALALANVGFLWFQPEISQDELRVIQEEQAKNEAALENPEAALEEVQKRIDEEASRLPEGDYDIYELTGKQLKALCLKRGLDATGNKFDLIARLEEAPDEDEVDLDSLDLKELKQVAKDWKVSTKGTREEIIERIVEAQQ